MDEIIKECEHQPNQSIFVYYKLRLTLDDEAFTEQKLPKLKSYHTAYKTWLSHLMDKGFISGKAAGGCEVKNKMGEYCKPHIHIHFRSCTKSETIKMSVRREWKKLYDENLKGNEMWSCKCCPYPDNDTKFYGYALKQQNPNRLDGLTLGFSSGDARDFCIAGNSIFKTTCEVNQAKDMKIKETQTLYDRLEIHLKATSPQLEEIVKFYIAEKRPINDATIVGYYNLYRVKNGLMSTASYAEILKSKYNV